MANLITISRFVLLLVLLAVVYQSNPWWQLANLPLVGLIFFSDALDGYVARRFGEESLFGATFDIAIDRVVENVLWVVLAHLGLVAVWVPIVFIIRGTLVDSIRGQGLEQGQAPFDIMESNLGRFLVAGSFMRASYAVIKAAAFGWILMYQPLPELYPAFWAIYEEAFVWTGMVLVWLAVAYCLARGLPVIIEFALREWAARRPQA